MRGTVGKLLLIAVCAASSAASASGSETAVTGTVVANPLSVRLWVNHAGVRVGEGTDVTATVSNEGATTLSSVQVRLHASPENVVIADGSDRVIEALPPSTQRKVTWRLCLREPGSYVFLASARLSHIGGDVESQAVVLEARPNRVRAC